jgi:hypothetical protein
VNTSIWSYSLECSTLEWTRCVLACRPSEVLGRMRNSQRVRDAKCEYCDQYRRDEHHGFDGLFSKIWNPRLFLPAFIYGKFPSTSISRELYQTRSNARRCVGLIRGQEDKFSGDPGLTKPPWGQRRRGGGIWAVYAQR